MADTITNPYYEEYYSAADTVFMFKGNKGIKPFEQIVNFQFAINNSKGPVYGYFSEDYDAIARGTRIVQGQFAVAMTDVYDLNRILNISNPEMDRSDYIAMKDAKDPNRIYDEWIGDGFDISIKFGSYVDVDKILTALKVTEKEKIAYRNGTTLDIIDVHINNISQYIDANDSTCLMLIYSFFAKMAPIKKSSVINYIPMKEKNAVKEIEEPKVEEPTINDIKNINVPIIFFPELYQAAPITSNNSATVISDLDKIIEELINNSSLKYVDEVNSLFEKTFEDDEKMNNKYFISIDLNKNITDKISKEVKDKLIEYIKTNYGEKIKINEIPANIFSTYGSSKLNIDNINNNLYNVISSNTTFNQSFINTNLTKEDIKVYLYNILFVIKMSINSSDVNNELYINLYKKISSMGEYFYSGKYNESVYLQHRNYFEDLNDPNIQTILSNLSKPNNYLDFADSEIVIK